MKLRLSIKREQGMTLVELFVVIAIVAVLVAMILPARTRVRVNSTRGRCFNNLKQVGLAFRVWEGDNGDKFPWEAGQTNLSTMEFSTGPNVWRYFQVASNELSTPRILFCPDDDARSRGTNFTDLSNTNLSYFIGLDATDANPDTFMSGDRNLTNGVPIENGILKLFPNHAADWTDEIHRKAGNILLADGSVQQMATAGLRASIAKDVAITNRLLMPVLPLPVKI